MDLYVDLSRAIWKSSGTPQHSTASKIGLNMLEETIENLIALLETESNTTTEWFQNN